MASVASIKISKVAELIWRIISGISVDSIPSKQEIETAVQMAATYWGKREMFDQYRATAEWITPSKYLVPFYKLPLVAYTPDVFSLKAILPEFPMDLPKNRGIDRVTYTDAMGREQRIPALSKGGKYRSKGSLFRKVGAAYFHDWIGNELIICGQCDDIKPVIIDINVYLVIINGDNIDKALEYVVISEVLKQYRMEVPKDYISDHNTTT